MVAFERFLVASREADWASNYIDYGGLKGVLAESVNRQKLAATLRRRGLVPSTSQDFAQTMDLSLGTSALGASLAGSDDMFCRALDREVEKVVIFFLKAQGEIANKLLHLRLRMRAIGPLAPLKDGEAKALRRLSSSADPTTGAEAGAVKPPATPTHLNHFHHRRMSASPSELTEEYQDICNQLCKLLRFIELNAEAVRKILKKHDRVLLADDDLMTGHYLTTRASRSPASHLRQLFHHNGISAIVSSLKSAIEEMPDQCRSLQESFVIRVQDREAIQEMMSALDKVQQARGRVHDKTNPFVSFLSLKPLIFDQEELEVGDIHELLHIPHGLSVWLNIAQIFLSTVNAYITVPTTNTYAESLGVNAAYSGVIIGMSPLAQIFSAFLFSWWSNFAFKSPLLLSCCLQLVGNILYGAALGYKSMPMLLLGRFIGGAGTAEAVNRRYIADVIPPRERTAASVAFVTASAVGMSAGPALAAMLFPVDFQVGRFPINDATAPAWLMVLLWAVMIVIMVVCFREPTHRHHNGGRRDAHKKRHHRRQDEQQQGTTAGRDGDEETAALNRPSSQRREGYGAVLQLKEAAAAEEAAEAGGAQTPTGPPEFYMTPSSTVGSSIVAQSPSRVKLRQHRLAKIHPMLFLVWRNKPLMITLAVYFLIEIIDEIILSSAGLIATHYFDWTISQVGGFMALLGLLVLPANLLVGESSGHGYEDRTIIVTSQAITILGLLLVISYWGEYTEFQFVVGTCVIFVAVAIMEGVDTSLMSKVIPPVLSRGTFNSGLLAVQIGMVAKALGDGMITLIGLRAEDLINDLYIPILIITVSLMLICIRYFSAMG